jgi:threonine dehydrogenase-like Zn-dependent dehydrogenase
LREKVIDPEDVLGRALTLRGSVVFPLSWMWDLARFCAMSGLIFEPAVTHRYPLDEAARAFEIADTAAGGKVVFVNG